MKQLKISNAKGFFLTADGDYSALDEMRKEDLVRMVDAILRGDGEMDEYDETLLQNQVHQIIYQSVYSKLVELNGRRAEFVDESKRLFLREYERYSSAKANESSEVSDEMDEPLLEDSFTED